MRRAAALRTLPLLALLRTHHPIAGCRANTAATLPSPSLAGCPALAPFVLNAPAFRVVWPPLGIRRLRLRGVCVSLNPALTDAPGIREPGRSAFRNPVQLCSCMGAFHRLARQSNDVGMRPDRGPGLRLSQLLRGLP
ncbi:uncharacterized protein BDZ99DRAFT_513095 [Mytilinidion resinicola]|uniref:Secreted protein n=1 Tax=Mytilinidion resinicola TaxID=574789 RepID=A0A6A6Z710_9PEZI|nr:uncharacterized protein BDZ99DRAFT_513095 [Mytilinidion resinicola]KAF2816820.1 hypothetical protein BDZ99DRAFT_513095 [Mytilinidion resinicola]